jgi:hypothetical protein
MFRLLTDRSGKKGADPYKWNDQIPICLDHFSHSEQEDYLRLTFFPESFIGEYFHCHGRSNVYFAKSFRLKYFLQRYHADIMPTPPLLALNIIEELSAPEDLGKVEDQQPLSPPVLNVIEELSAPETLDNVEDQQPLSPPVLNVMDELPAADLDNFDSFEIQFEDQKNVLPLVPNVMEELAAACDLDNLETGDIQIEDQHNLLVSGKRKVKVVEKSRRTRKRVKSELKENVTNFFGENNFLAFLKAQVENVRFSLPP